MTRSDRAAQKHSKLEGKGNKKHEETEELTVATEAETENLKTRHKS